MSHLNIALLQIAPGPTLEANLQKGLSACRQARQKGADIALFPEMWSIGYRIYDRPAAEWTAGAIPADGTFVRAFGALAQELGMAIGVTFLEQSPAGVRNSLVLWDRLGRRALTYAKVHTCDFGAERHLTPGDGFSVCTLDTACGPVEVGAMICFDREFPESARILMLQGAELILTPNACPMEVNRLSQLRGRAYENMLAIATCNYPAGVPDCNGHSTVFDGVAYLPDADGSRDTCILEAGGAEGIYIAKLDLAQLRRYRAAEVHGNAYRRPTLYAPLTNPEVRPPFLRPDRRR
ncbi:MAG TPA: carbon-nitrogen hydrolase family protein [Candidatus Faecalibacterium faecipullorum]|uniref:Carbon-nitrogen hydrolase family protein n=1 Tax=Candidatus Faecalibacterium faecipullorum TaxID=2838578 RepID=A0A9D2S7Y3_9FIRM|nr:carbon-nitrogen hydrolase family protein [Candidatus Faecalibacterium faecipullorum]